MGSNDSNVLAISVKNVYFGYRKDAMIIKNLSMGVDQGWPGLTCHHMPIV